MTEMTTAARRPVEDYTLGELLEDIRRQDVSVVLTGTGSILALVASAMLERIGEKPDGKADVKVEVGDVTEVRIRWA